MNLTPGEYTPQPQSSSPNLLEIMGVTPEDAQARLADMIGDDFYDQATIVTVKDNWRAGRTGSHHVRALLRIAEGSETRLLGDVYSELRTEDGLSPTRHPLS